MEYVEQFALDPKLAYTPELNTAMLDMTEAQNFEEYLKTMSESEAKTMARNERRSAEKSIAKLGGFK